MLEIPALDKDTRDLLFNDDSVDGQKAARGFLKAILSKDTGTDKIASIIEVASAIGRGDLLAEIGSFLRSTNATRDQKQSLAIYTPRFRNMHVRHQGEKRKHHELVKKEQRDPDIRDAYDRCAVVLCAIISTLSGPQEKPLALEVPQSDGIRARMMGILGRSKVSVSAPTA